MNEGGGGVRVRSWAAWLHSEPQHDAVTGLICQLTFRKQLLGKLGTTCNLWTLRVAKQRSKEVQLNTPIWHSLNFMHVFGRVNFSERFLHLLETQNPSCWGGAMRRAMCLTLGSTTLFQAQAAPEFPFYFFKGIAIDLLVHKHTDPSNELQIIPLRNHTQP